MTKLPVIKPRECIKALESIGFHVDRQHGSHIIMRRDNPYAQAVIPNLPKSTGARSGRS